MNQAVHTGAKAGLGFKFCPLCGYKNSSRIEKCKNPTGCSQVWVYEKKPKPAPAPQTAPPPETTPKSDYIPPIEGKFACGFVTGGGAFLFWPEKDEYIELTPKQWDLIYFLAMGVERPTKDVDPSKT